MFHDDPFNRRYRVQQLRECRRRQSSLLSSVLQQQQRPSLVVVRFVLISILVYNCCFWTNFPILVVDGAFGRTATCSTRTNTEFFRSSSSSSSSSLSRTITRIKTNHHHHHQRTLLFFRSQREEVDDEICMTMQQRQERLQRCRTIPNRRIIRQRHTRFHIASSLCQVNLARNSDTTNINRMSDIETLSTAIVATTSIGTMNETKYIVPQYLAQRNNLTLTFYRTTNGRNSNLPITIHDLLDMEPGEFVSTEPIVLYHNNNNIDSSYNTTITTNNNINSTFRLNLYPFGTSTSATTKQRNKTNGFGMLYQMEPLSKDIDWMISTLFGKFTKEKEQNSVQKFQQCNVAIYLEYLESLSSSRTSFVDTSFTIRLCGSQTKQMGPRFDIEWKAGMRYIGNNNNNHNNKSGTASLNRDGTVSTDFGSSLMRSYLLPSFFGDNGDNSEFENVATTNNNVMEPIRARLDIQIHDPLQYLGSSSINSNLLQPLVPRDIRYGDYQINDKNQLQQHDIEQVRVGRVVVPICTKLSQRSKMFQLGAYPGVEYRIMRIHIPNNDCLQDHPQVTDANIDATTMDVFYSQPGAYYDLKPIYPLVQQLERPWPVTVRESTDIPRLYTPTQYNTISAIGSLFTAISGLFVAYIISQCVSLYYIPSRSMEPTLQIGDVLLVEKITPIMNHRYRTNDVVLFTPPSPLQDIVTKSGGTIDRRSLFVKRVAATEGDRIIVDPTGKVQITQPSGQQQTNYNRNLCVAEPIGLIKKFLPTTTQETTLLPNTVEVLGDCSSVSIDSRVWGELSTDNIVGRPIVRLWPINKFGRIPDLPPVIE